MAEFLSLIFCGGTKVELQQCEANGILLESEKKILEIKVADNLDEISRLQGLCNEYLVRAELAEADTARFYEELMKAVRVPELGGLSSRVLVDPWNMTQTQWKGVRCELISDDGYYAFPEETWVKVLGPIQVEVERVLGKAKPETVDCDNYTLTMCDLVSLTFNRAGLNAQGAFMKLISKPHSYCGFMLPNYTIRVYDPMNGKVIGNRGETAAGDYGADTYRTELAYFLA